MAYYGGFSFDFVAEINHAWSWSAQNKLLFPNLFGGIVSADVMVWFFFWIFFVIAFYEFFVDCDESQQISGRIKYSIYVGILTLLIVVLIFKLDPNLLRLPYAYLLLGVLALIQSAYVIYKNPALLKKIIRVIPFFFFVYLVFEIIALHLLQWTFPGQYLGFFRFDDISIPFEELFFWITASSAVAASYHELYVDDLR